MRAKTEFNPRQKCVETVGSNNKVGCGRLRATGPAEGGGPAPLTDPAAAVLSGVAGQPHPQTWRGVRRLCSSASPGLASSSEKWNFLGQELAVAAWPVFLPGLPRKAWKPTSRGWNVFGVRCGSSWGLGA